MFLGGAGGGVVDRVNTYLPVINIKRSWERSINSTTTGTLVIVMMQ
jgi:hypothetical protein